MSKLVWASDIHLNFLPRKETRELFYEDIKNSEPDVVVISGDIAESHNVVELLAELESHVNAPVLFVLGNHDFYGSSVKEVKTSIAHLGYLPKSGVTALSESTAIVGVDGWGDCRNGDYEHSTITMSDWIWIKELNAGYRQGMTALKKAIQKLADSDARKLRRRVLNAVKQGFKRVFIITHVPPFEGACLFAGRKSTPDGLCFWSSQILGTMIKPIAKEHPEVEFTWLCGHTHSGVNLHVLSNLEVQVAHAEYYYPTVAGVIEYD